MTPLYLGWQYATPHADPGPPPEPPSPGPLPPGPDPAGQPASPGPPPPSGAWLAAQQQAQNRLDRPLKITAAAGTALAVLAVAGAVAGWLPAVVAVPAVVLGLAVAVQRGYAVARGGRQLRMRAAAEQVRAARLRGDQEGRARRAQAEHGHRASQWRAQWSAFTSQKRWYAVPVPGGIDRVDVAGGTLAGWSALLTMAAAYQLNAGGEATVIDLSGGAAAAELADLCARTAGAAGEPGGPGTAGVPPAVWVLPQDLPRLDIAAPLAPAELAHVLALSVSVAEDNDSRRDLSVDTSILERVIGVLAAGDDPRPGGVPVSRVAAALRAVAQVGDPHADRAAGLLTDREAAALSVLYGSAADRVVLERALGMEAQLRRLAAVGSEPAALPPGRLRVIAVDRRASAQTASILGSFAVTALTHLIGQLPAARGPVSWRHPVFLLGAERLRADVLDRLTDACEAAGCGLVLAYRSLPPHVRQRIGRGNAAVAFMRLGNAEDARAAAEQIGSEYRFVVSQLTETVGTSVTDTLGGSYTSTVGDSYSAATSDSDSETRSDGTGRSSPSGGGALPLRGGGSRSAQTGTSWGTSASTSLTAGISTSTAWGVSTSRAAGDSESLARSLQRSRELVVEPSELQRLPATAMIVSYGAGAQRHVLLADANPAIGALPVATLTPLPEPAELPGTAGAAGAAAMPGPSWEPAPAERPRHS